MDKDLYGNMKMVWYSNKFLFDLLENSFRFLKIKSPPTGSKCVDGASIDIERFEKKSFLTVCLVTLKITRDFKILWEDHKKGPHEKVEKWLPVANKTIWFNFSLQCLCGPQSYRRLRFSPFLNLNKKALRLSSHLFHMAGQWFPCLLFEFFRSSHCDSNKFKQNAQEVAATTTPALQATTEVASHQL